MITHYNKTKYPNLGYFPCLCLFGIPFNIQFLAKLYKQHNKEQQQYRTVRILMQIRDSLINKYRLIK